jgi:HK97 family phage major capsid protein
MSTLIERVQERIAQLAARETELAEELSAIADDPEARGLDTDGAISRVGELRTEITQVRSDRAEAEERASQLADERERQERAAAARPANVGGAVVRQEARTYEAHNAQERSFFADAYASQYGSSPQAQERIQRHMREVEVERRDITSATLNGLIPPLYLLDQAAELARAMRPFADVVPGYDLPANGMSVVVTKVTTGTATGVQTTQNTAATETDLVTTDITIPVVTIMGQQDVSRQAIERGAVTDALIFRDLVADYATKLDQNVINGGGSAGASRGILNVTGVGVQTWGGTSVASFISKLNGNLNDVASNRFAPATVIVMHPRRWHWLLAQADTVGRNVVLPAQNQPQNAAGIGQTGYGVAGTLAGLPVVVDANVPTTASTDQDRVIVTRLSDHALWEGGLMSFTFEQAVNPPATVRLAVAGYSAFTAERYPAATSVMVGTGLVAPTF